MKRLHSSIEKALPEKQCRVVKEHPLLLPQEIWSLVISFSISSIQHGDWAGRHPMGTMDAQASQLLGFGLVNSQWHSITDKLFYSLFFHAQASSDRFLRRFAPKIQYLNLSFNTFTDASLQNLQNLTCLDLSFSQTPQISDQSISKLTNLTSFDMRFGPQKIGPRSVAHLTNLQSFSTSRFSANSYTHTSRFGAYFSSFQTLTNLTRLDINLRNNDSYFEKLKILTNLNHLGLITASDSFDCATLLHFPFLTSLDLPANAGNLNLKLLTKLLKLNIESNFSVENSTIAQLTSLTNLNLAQNERILPMGILPLTKLKKLNLNMNNAIPFGVLNNFPNLSHLSISHPVSSRLIPLPNLTHLRFSVGFLSAELSRDNFVCLQSLWIEDELIPTNIDPFLQQVTGLMDLRLNCALASDSSIQLLTGLTWLDIMCNTTSLITHQSLSRLTNLKGLVLRGAEAHLRGISRSFGLKHVDVHIGASPKDYDWSEQE